MRASHFMYASENTEDSGTCTEQTCKCLGVGVLLWFKFKFKSGKNLQSKSPDHLYSPCIGLHHGIVTGCTNQRFFTDETKLEDVGPP